ncbi:hypothetical protein A6A29_00380 [Streptomyces sp. TSRI0281]|nr:hypothetical protein A6A29_00380 [Streptomyces sp. TSRI0281]
MQMALDGAGRDPEAASELLLVMVAAALRTICNSRGESAAASRPRAESSSETGARPRSAVRGASARTAATSASRPASCVRQAWAPAARSAARSTAP